jgi:diacylglycerol O-acyltransferase / wax synthase
VLMICSSALRRYFAKRRLLPRKSLVAAVPISLRAKGDTTSDNQASMSFISLGTHISEPRKRLAHIKAATAQMKSTMGSLKSILPTDFPSLGLPWLMEAAASLYGRAKVADRIPQVANVVISNVPGPPVPLFMAGAKMITNYPTSIVVHGMALNITVQSYDRSMDFGIIADAQAMPDVRELADAISIALDDLRALPRPGEAESDDARAPGAIEAAAKKAAGRAVKGLRSAVTGAVTGAVKGAVSTAVSGVMGNVVSRTVKAAVAQVTKPASSKAKKATVTRATAPAKKKVRA